MKTIRFTGETPAAFGSAGAFSPGQETCLEAATADRLIAKGYFVEVKPPKKEKTDIIKGA